MNLYKRGIVAFYYFTSVKKGYRKRYVWFQGAVFLSAICIFKLPDIKTILALFILLQGAPINNSESDLLYSFVISLSKISKQISAGSEACDITVTSLGYLWLLIWYPWYKILMNNKLSGTLRVNGFKMKATKSQWPPNNFAEENGAIKIVFRTNNSNNTKINNYGIVVSSWNIHIISFCTFKFPKSTKAQLPIDARFITILCWKIICFFNAIFNSLMMWIDYVVPSMHDCVS